VRLEKEGENQKANHKSEKEVKPNEYASILAKRDKLVLL